MAKNINELIKELQAELNKIIELIAQDVENEIDNALSIYYQEYHPKRYIPRTYQLRNCCHISAPKITGNSISIEVYLDISSLNYTQKGADPYKTVVAADVGLHGGYDITEEKIIPWKEIDPASHSLTGSEYSGTSIWTDPIEDMIKNRWIQEWFIEHARKRGLTIKEM